MDLLNRLWNQVRALLVNISPSQRVSLAILGASIVISLTMLVLMSAGSNRVPLYYTQLANGDAATIVKFLNENNYKVEYEDGMLYVSPDQKDEILLKIGGEGIDLEGADPFDYLKDMDFSKTDDQRQKMHLHATEQNLARIIRKISVVQQAYVTLTANKESLYVFGNEEKPKASVLLKLGFGRELDRDQVLGIANLVASAMRDLPPANVAITDTSGKVYRIPDKDNAGIEDHLRLTKQYEAHLEEKVSGMFNAFMRGAHVTANIVLNKKYIEENFHDVLGDAGTEVIDKKKTTESEKTINPPAQEVGTTTALRNNGGGTGKSTERDFKEEDGGKVDWDRLDRFVRSHPDAIEKKSLSVIVPWDLAALKDGEQELNPTEADANVQANLQRWAGMVSTAAGIEDVQDITLQAVSFRIPEDAVLEMNATQQVLEFLNQNWYKGALLGFLAVAFGMVYVTLKRSLPDLTIQEEQLTDESAELPEIALNVDELRVERMRERIQEKVVENPETAADLIERWMRKG